MLCNGAVGDDSRPHAGPKRREAGAERGKDVAADDNVIGAIAERHVDNGDVGLFQRRGHGAALTESGAGCERSLPCRAAMHSSTILSCGTSREEIVMSAS